jgi:hypothetical protein
MSLIHIANPEGQQTSYEEPEARRLWSEGAIPQASLYWREGMKEWRPSLEFFGAVPSSAPAALPPLVSCGAARGFAKDPVSLTKKLVVLLWAYLVAAALAGVAAVIALLAGGAAATNSDELSGLDLVNLIIGVPQLLITIVTGVVFLMWIYRANLNARGLGAQGMTFTPGWSVGYYFVPIMNLWKPYQAMKEIWQASEHPVSWSSAKPSSLLATWWGLWIASCILGQAAFRSSFSATTESAVMVSTVIGILTDLVDIPLCLVAMRMVREIIRMQTQWAVQPVQSICVICRQPLPQTEMIILNGVWVCATCKPVMVQRMQEGMRNP